MVTKRRRPKASMSTSLGADDLYNDIDQTLESFGSNVSPARQVKKAIGCRTGVLSIDVALGGGLPSGITEITGEESVGKTALVGKILAEQQSRGATTALVRGDVLDRLYLEALGVRLDELVILPGPDEDLTHLVVDFLRSNKPALVVIDSLNGVRVVEPEDTWKEYMLFFLEKVKEAIPVESAVVVTTQVRSRRSADPRKVFAGGTASSASRIQDFFDTRLQLSRTGVGEYLYTMGVDIKKNALGRPGRYLEVPATKGHGIEYHLDLVQVAVSLGVLELRGPRMYYGKSFLGMGARGAAEAIGRSQHLMNEVLRRILSL